MLPIARSLQESRAASSRSRDDRRTLVTKEVLMYDEIASDYKLRGKKYPVTNFYARRCEEWPTTHNGQPYIISLCNLQRQVRRLREHVASGEPRNEWTMLPVGRPYTLTRAQEQLAVRRITNLARQESGVTMQMAAAEVEVVAASPLLGDTAADVAKRVMRCGGKQYMRSLCHRYNLSVSKRGRALELERAMGQQPERRLNYHRIIYRAHAFAHAHRRYLEFKEPATPNARRLLLQHQLRNYTMSGGVLQYEEEGDGGGVLAVKDGEFVVPDLDEELIMTKPKFVANGDEKPWDCNQCRTTSLSAPAVRANVRSGARSSYWTVMCWIRANGEALPPLIIVDGQSVPADRALVDILTRTGASVTATENGFMDNAVFLAELRRFCGMLGNGEEPAILLLDGHGSRLQREAVRILSEHHIYCVVEPSNSSTDNQALDNGAMVSFNEEYRSLYTTALNRHDPVSSTSDRIVLALKAYELASETNRFRSCWKGALLENGVPQPHKLGPKVCPFYPAFITLHFFFFFFFF